MSPSSRGPHFNGRNQRLILNYLRYISGARWSTREEIREATGIKPGSLQRTLYELVSHYVVDQRVDPYDGRKRLYRRRELV